MRDFLIVGAGLYGSVMARELVDAGKSVMVIEKRDRAGGNCATEMRYGIPVHLHGGHVFHTDEKLAWDYVNQYAEFYPWTTSILAERDGVLLPFPINLSTLEWFHGSKLTPESGKVWMESHEQELKDFFYRDYSMKQWGMTIEELPQAIPNRIPVRTTYSQRRFNTQYEGLPVDGYEKLFKNLLAGSELWLYNDYLKYKERFNKMAQKVIYSGPIDALFNCEYGELPYRSLDIQFWEAEGDYQGVVCINCVGRCHPWTKTTEFKHFLPDPRLDKTIVSRETPIPHKEGRERYYPIPTKDNAALAQKYINRARAEGYWVGGRLGTYRYIDMDKVVIMALDDAREVLREC